MFLQGCRVADYTDMFSSRRVRMGREYHGVLEIRTAFERSLALQVMYLSEDVVSISHV